MSVVASNLLPKSLQYIKQISPIPLSHENLSSEYRHPVNVFVSSPHTCWEQWFSGFLCEGDSGTWRSVCSWVLNPGFLSQLGSFTFNKHLKCFWKKQSLQNMLRILSSYGIVKWHVKSSHFVYSNTSTSA